MAAAASANLLSFFKSQALPHSPPPKWRRSAIIAASPDVVAADSELRLVFAGGGSGGHIYPALAIADEIRASRTPSRIVFVGTPTGMEHHLVPAAGYEFIPVPTSRLSRPFLSPRNLLLPLALLRSVIKSWRILCALRPHLVVGTGAYVSAPVCLAAALSGVRFVIQEQNCYPGVTNRVVAPYAEKIFLAFSSCLKYFPREKCLVVGNPIRETINQEVSKEEARSHFFPNAAEGKVQVVLVLGGSTGASALNTVFSETCCEMLEQHKDRYIIWQTGAEWYDQTKSHAKNHQRLLLVPFLEGMDLAYAAADLVVSRAGAMTCTEILTTGKASILIPCPRAAEDHQTQNAYIMADIAGAKVLTEELDPDSLKSAIDEVLGDENMIAEMSEKAKRAARPHASSDIAQSILSLVESSS